MNAFLASATRLRPLLFTHYLLLRKDTKNELEKERLEDQFTL